MITDIKQLSPKQSAILSDIMQLEKQIKGFDFRNNDDISKELQWHSTLSNKLCELDDSIGTGVQAGRFLDFSVADGKAIYIITKVLKRIVKVQHIRVGDAWRSDAVSSGNSVEYHKAQSVLGFRDTWNELIRSKNKSVPVQRVS